MKDYHLPLFCLTNSKGYEAQNKIIIFFVSGPLNSKKGLLKDHSGFLVGTYLLRKANRNIGVSVRVG
jgi:hypothetical protein